MEVQGSQKGRRSTRLLLGLPDSVNKRFFSVVNRRNALLTEWADSIIHMVGTNRY